MDKIKAIILDDEPEAVAILSKLLVDTGKVEVIKALNDPLKLESSVSSLKPDVVFLDIEMPNYNGIQILKNLREYQPALLVVYVSAHNKFALEAAKHNPFSYLLKPVESEELNDTIDKIIFYHESKESNDINTIDKFTLPVKGGMIYVNYKDIFSLTADRNYTFIKLTNGKTKLSSYNLGKLHKQISNRHFVRVNRYTILNRNYLTEISKRGKYCIASVNDIEEKFDVSKEFLKTIKK